MVLHEDMIVDIPEERVKYFGTTGRMLLPGTVTITNLLEQIPESKVVTTGIIRDHLARQFSVEGVCPVTTKKAIIAIAKDPDCCVPYWRVINQDGGLVANFPGGKVKHAEQLHAEGLPVVGTKQPIIMDYQVSIHTFD